MTFAEIQELFIRAAYIEMTMMKDRPMTGGGSPWPRYEYEAGDIEGWTKEAKKARDLRIARNGGEYGDARRSREAIDLHERASELIALVKKPQERRALLHWAMAKAGGRPFVRFCDGEKIHVETGTRWKNQAIRKIVERNEFSELYDSANDDFVVLPDRPEKGHKTPMLAIDATTRGSASRDQETEASRETILAGWRGSRTAWRRIKQAMR